MRKLTFFSLLALVTTTLAFSSRTTWNVDRNYEVAFATRAAKGTFEGLNGRIQFDPNNLPASKMDVSVEVNTIETGNSTKNKHAKGKSWFHAEKYPTIRFESSAFSKDKDLFRVKGKLTLHGVSKEITIPFTFNDKGTRAVFEGSFTVNRKDYGIKGNAAGFTVGKDIVIDLKVPVKK